MTIPANEAKSKAIIYRNEQYNKIYDEFYETHADDLQLIDEQIELTCESGFFKTRVITDIPMKYSYALEIHYKRLGYKCKLLMGMEHNEFEINWFQDQ